MKTHEFFAKYANTPMKERDIDKDGITLNEIYIKIKVIEDKIRPDVIERDRLLKRAERIYISYE